MKIRRRKMAALLLAVAAPGFMVFSCTGTVGRQFRDAALAGAANFVTAETFDILSALFPDLVVEE